MFTRIYDQLPQISVHAESTWQLVRLGMRNHGMPHTNHAFICLYIILKSSMVIKKKEKKRSHCSSRLKSASVAESPVDTITLPCWTTSSIVPPLLGSGNFREMSLNVTGDFAALEFRASDDDAWYAANIVLAGETLIVKFANHGSEFDEKFRATDFRDEASVQQFKERIRPSSVQLQDSMCRKAIEGMTICASYAFSDGAIKFYDAVIDDVIPKDHAFDKGKDMCSCQFVLFWQHGPNDGLKTYTGIENICLRQTGRAIKNPALNSFLEVTRKKLQRGSQESHSISDCETAQVNAVLLHEICQSTSKQESNRRHTPKMFKVKENPKKSHAAETFEGYIREKFGQDVDLGSEFSFTTFLREKSDWFFVIIDNVEKDLSSSAIVGFIYQHTSIICHAHVSPSLSWEVYTRGTIFVKGRKKLEELRGFLQNPSHLIISSKGRPWIIVEEDLRNGTFKGLTQISKKSLCKIQGAIEEIKVVQEGTAEYDRGKRLAVLFLEFVEHLQPLHKRLLLEERNAIL